MVQPPSRPRVVLADDDDAIRRAITRLLKPSCDIVGYGPDTATLFAVVQDTRPDVVLLDFSLPGGPNGLDVCRRLKQIAPEVKVVVFTANNDKDVERLACEAGASSFVWKLQASSDLLPAIQAVVALPADTGAGTA